MAAKHGILAREVERHSKKWHKLTQWYLTRQERSQEGGEPTVLNAEVLSSKTSLERKVVLGIAASLESASSHPLGLSDPEVLSI